MRTKAIRTDSLGDRVAELARESRGPRLLSGVTLADAELVARAVKRTGLEITVSRLRETGETFSLILKGTGDKFAALADLQPVVRMSREDISGYEMALFHLAQESALLANPKAVHIPKIALLPWRDEQPTRADMLRFFPYCDVESREEITLAPLTIQATNEPPRAIGYGTPKRYATLADALAG
jgi:hypothetical protein